jgi:Ni/Co efflux regulator RcnB
MRKVINTAIVVTLLATAAPALAQHRPAPHRGPSWHEMQSSRGNHWRRGQRLSVAQRRWRVNDWQRRGLRAPPRGYYWVRENNNSGDYILVAAATGLIASILASQ